MKTWRSSKDGYKVNGKKIKEENKEIVGFAREVLSRSYMACIGKRRVDPRGAKNTPNIHGAQEGNQKKQVWKT